MRNETYTAPLIPSNPSPWHDTGNRNHNHEHSLKIENFQLLSVIAIPELLKYKSRFTISARNIRSLNFYGNYLPNKYVRLIGLSTRFRQIWNRLLTDCWTTAVCFKVQIWLYVLRQSLIIMSRKFPICIYTAQGCNKAGHGCIGVFCNVRNTHR